MKNLWGLESDGRAQLLKPVHVMSDVPSTHRKAKISWEMSGRAPAAVKTIVSLRMNELVQKNDERRLKAGVRQCRKNGLFISAGFFGPPCMHAWAWILAASCLYDGRNCASYLHLTTFIQLHCQSTNACVFRSHSLVSSAPCVDH